MKIIPLNNNTCRQPLNKDSGINPNFFQLIFLIQIAKISSTRLVTNINIFSAGVMMIVYQNPDTPETGTRERLSPSTKTFSSKSFVWAPTRLFFLLEK